MPPTKRKKTKKAATLDVKDVENGGAALKVPTEIWMEIVSGANFLVLGSEKDGIPRSLLLLSRSKIPSAPKTIPPAYRVRPETLRALSQTCRTLRAIFLPLLWEHVEACITSKSGTPWLNGMSAVLLDRCKGLMKRPNQHLARYVRVFSVSLSDEQIASTVSLFARCLESLPNLETLHILYVKSEWEDIVTEAFGDVELPGVRTIILPSYAHAILAACPGVRNVSSNEEIGTQLFDTLIENCPAVERMQGFELTPARLEELSENLPKLREIAVPAHLDISSLAVINTLSVIELIAKQWEDVNEADIDAEDFSPGTAFKQKLVQARQKRIDAARAVLEASSGQAPKLIKISYWQDITGMVGMTDYTYGHYWVKADEYDV
ncbi:hypothetical protein DFH06DRAFT_1226763 [Mycena polygramma]|nr:hypothetical protein DFH06DRAFT_1226763 [Mycena polygramma]